MRKSVAIKILKRQKQIFIDKSYIELSAWKQLTSSYILDFFGQESSEYYAFYKFSFDAVATSNEQLDSIIAMKEKAMIGLLDNCIDKISTGKLYREPQSNILSSQTNERLIAIIFAISFVVFGIGYYFGTEKTNRDLIQTENKYKNLKDSLSSVKPFVDSNNMIHEKK